MNASILELGSLIGQKGKPITFYSRKLNPVQVNYTTTERQLVSIVAKELRNMHLRELINVYTTFNTERNYFLFFIGKFLIIFVIILFITNPLLV